MAQNTMMMTTNTKKSLHKEKRQEEKFLAFFSRFSHKKKKLCYHRNIRKNANLPCHWQAQLQIQTVALTGTPIKPLASASLKTKDKRIDSLALTGNRVEPPELSLHESIRERIREKSALPEQKLDIIEKLWYDVYINCRFGIKEFLFKCLRKQSFLYSLASLRVKETKSTLRRQQNLWHKEVPF